MIKNSGTEQRFTMLEVAAVAGQRFYKHFKQHYFRLLFNIS